MTMVCSVPVSPLRSSPSHKSEMVSQLLFGELASVIESTSDNWHRIVCQYDNYEGWVTSSHLLEIRRQLPCRHITSGWSNQILFNTQPMHLSFGSDLRGIQNGQAEWNQYNWSYKGDYMDPENNKRDAKNILNVSSIFLNVPYLWGGRSSFGIDCSGFTQLVFKALNIPLQRDAWQQSNQGELVGFIQESKCGDLAFFDNEEGRIVHVGILLNNNQIIHAAGKVRLDQIDIHGIINVDTGERTHQLRIIKRYF